MTRDDDGERIRCAGARHGARRAGHAHPVGDVGVTRRRACGDLLQRMPAGLMQLVGETGWQLSHGERSRLYIARTLLQRAELIVLDESFAALDPENLRLALDCVLKRGRTVLAIAHR